MERARIQRQLISGGTLGAGVILVAALVGIVNYFGMKYYQRFDWTGSKLYTLSEKTTNVLGNLSRDVEVTVFMRPQSELFASSRELLERYAAKSKHLQVKVVDPEKNLIEAQRLVDKYQVKSLSVVVFDAGDDRRVVEESDLADYDYSGMQYGAGPEMTGFKGEEAFTSALLSLVEKRKPKILFTTGHGEASRAAFDERGLSRAQDLLGKENFEMQDWASLGQAQVPPGTDLVVIAGPTAKLVEPELDALAKYLEGGGRLLILLDPTIGQSGQTGGLADTGLGPWLARYGVAVGDDIVVDPSSPLPFFGADTIFVSASGDHAIVRALQQAKLPVIFPLARSVAKGTAPAGMEATELLHTSAEGWGETDLAHLQAVKKDPQDLQGPVSLAVAVAAAQAKPPSPMEEEEMENQPPKPEAEPAVSADSAHEEPAGAKPTWRLVVLGDSDFASNRQLDNVGNPTLLANSFNWLVERQNLLGIGPKKPEQVRLNLTSGQLSAITWLVLGLLPGLAVAAGVTVYMKRRR